MFFFSFLCSGISDLALGILTTLLRVYFPDVLQLAVSQVVPGVIWLSASLYSKCTVCTVVVCHLQILALHKKILS